MKISIKTLIIFLIALLFVFCTYVYASEISLQDESSDEITFDLIENEEEEPDPEVKEESLFDNFDEDENYKTDGEVVSQDYEVTTTSSPTITTTNKVDNELSVSDIINIILIAVCVVLIFLAIAILIRCKQ